MTTTSWVGGPGSGVFGHPGRSMLLLSLSLALAACGGSDTTPLPDLGGADVPADAATDTSGPVDLPADTARDDGPAADLPGDDGPAPTDPGPGDPSAADAPAEPDVAPADAPADPGPPVPPTRAAWAFLDNPDENGGQPAQVALRHLTDPQGRLIGAFADVLNCLPEPGGQRVWLSQDEYADLCNPRRTVTPDGDGTYLHVLPPGDLAAGDDAFGEVQMYFHVNAIHDYFTEVHGADYGGNRISGLVNVQVNYQDQGWLRFDNAMYLPGGALGQMGVDIGVYGDMLVFGQGETIDYAYEADVIQHEFTHFTVGPWRLAAYASDEWGLDASPVALNEGMADYFPASLAGSPILGGWALKVHARDLSQPRRCPDDLTGESHADGRIWSSALWEIRTALGAPTADLLAFAALDKSGGTTTFEDMAGLLLEATDENAAQARPTVEAVLQARGLDRCERIRDWRDGEQFLYVEGTRSNGIKSFRQSVPAALQLRVQVPEGATALVVEARAKMSGLSAILSPGLPMRLALAAKAGTERISYAYFPSLSSTADGIVTADADAEGRFRFVLAGSCLVPGPLTLQFLNRTEIGVALTEAALTVQTAPFEGTTTFDCAAP